MQPLDATLQVGAAQVRLLGTIPLFAPEARRVEEAAAGFRPACVAAGVPPEDAASLDRLAADAAAREELAALDEVEERYRSTLDRWGATAVPSPDMEAAHRLARAAGIPFEAIDLGDSEHADLYTREVPFGNVLRSNGIRKRLAKKGLEAATALEFALAWDRELARPAGVARVEAEQERHMAQRLRALAVLHPRVLAVLPAGRWAGVAADLSATRIVPASAKRP